MRIPLTLISMLLTAQIAFGEVAAEVGNVALERSEDYSLSYKERRGSHGVLFAIEMEKFYPVDYESLNHDVYIENVIGTGKIDLVGFEIGYKYNVSVLSVAALFTYAKGTAEGARILDVVRQGLSANVALDGFFDEPWVVPYFQAGMHQFSLAETSSTFSLTGSASMAINYRYGLLFQLNWIENAIDKSSQGDALRSSGLENTFIDIYFADHLASGNAQDPTTLGSDGEPNLASAGEIGMGIKLEF